MEATTPTKRPSLRRALLHAVIAFFLFLAVLVGLMRSGVIDGSPESARGWGRVGFYVLIVAFALSYFRQESKYQQRSILRRMAVGALLGLAVLAPLAGGSSGVAPSGVAPSGVAPSGPLTEKEKAGLVPLLEGGAQYLKHPHLGFSLRDPGPGFRAPTADEEALITQEFKKKIDGGDLHVYLYFAKEQRAVLLLLLERTTLASEGDLQGFVRGMISGAGENLGEAKSEIRWEGDHGEARVRGSGKGVHSFTRVFAGPLGPEQGRYMISLSGFAQTPGALDEIIESFRSR
jgi:hypothetical protein